ncbi:MAG TPA: hypothetical protein VK991_14625, partial [Halomonas sp.]|nr:hypothetical protein [Halomonas sp.]
MDITLLTGPVGHRAGPPQVAPGASPDANFHASLAQAAGRASGSDARSGEAAPDGGPSTALTALAAALDDAPGAVRERIAAALDGGQLESGRLRRDLSDLLDQAGLADDDREVLMDALESAMAAREAEGEAPERHAGLAPLPGALHQALDPRPTAAPAAAGGADGDAWATLHERLALIEQAGRPAATEQAAARPFRATLTPQHHSLLQENDEPRAAPAPALNRSAPQAGVEPSVAAAIQRLAAAPQQAAQAAGPEPGAYGPLLDSGATSPLSSVPGGLSTPAGA